MISNFDLGLLPALQHACSSSLALPGSCQITYMHSAHRVLDSVRDRSRKCPMIGVKELPQALEGGKMAVLTIDQPQKLKVRSRGLHDHGSHRMAPGASPWQCSSQDGQQEAPRPATA